MNKFDILESDCLFDINTFIIIIIIIYTWNNLNSKTAIQSMTVRKLINLSNPSLEFISDPLIIIRYYIIWS